jgi:hypothetical protein
VIAVFAGCECGCMRSSPLSWHRATHHLATIASATQANKCPLKPNTKQAPARASKAQLNKQARASKAQLNKQARTSKAQLNKQARTSKAQLRPPSPSSSLPSISILVPPLNPHTPPLEFARVRQRSCRQLLPVSEELLRNGAGGWERTRTVCGGEQKGRRWPDPYVPAPAGRAAPRGQGPKPSRPPTTVQRLCC